MVVQMTWRGRLETSLMLQLAANVMTLYLHLLFSMVGVNIPIAVTDDDSIHVAENLDILKGIAMSARLTTDDTSMLGVIKKQIIFPPSQREIFCIC